MKGELPLESALLFKVPEQLSPRLAWKRKFNISTQDHGYHPESEFERWSAWSGDLHKAIGNGSLASGTTEDDAIAEWARRHNVRLWNEECLP
jgi:hypothetical protein